jgi:molybdate transport system ATP-binding protein
MDRPALEVSARQAGPIPLDLAFTCAPGELLAVVGASGAGKSTLLRLIAGLYRPAQGRVVCNGAVWLDTATGEQVAPHARHVGLVFQSYALFPHLSARDNVAAALGHLPGRARREAADRLLARVQLGALADRKPAALSGGQQQRVALARALAREPEVLLLDEPFSAVDRRTRRQLQADLLTLRGGLRTPIILVTHDVDDAVALADRLAVLDHGRLLQIGPTRAVLDAPASALVRDLLDLPGAG